MQSALKNRPASILPLLWVMLFDHASLNVTFPVLTLLFFDVQSSLFAPDTTHAVRSMWYGLCVAAPHLVNIVMTPILSALSDEVGRKKILLVGTLGAFLFAVTAAGGILLGSLSVLFFGLIIRGAFSRTNPIAQAVIGDISPIEHKVRYMGYLQAAISVGACAGPVIGGYFANQFFFAKLNFSLPFFIAALFALISCLLTLFIFKETLIDKRKRVSRSVLNVQAIKKVFANQQVWRISAVLFLSQVSWSLYYQFMPPILKTELGFNPHALGFFVGLIALWLTLATAFGIKILEYFFSFRHMLFFSLYLVFLGLLLSVFFCLFHMVGQSLIFVWLAAIPTAVGDVIAYSCLITLYSNTVEKQDQGTVMGICFIIVAIIWSLTGLLGGIMMSYAELMPLMVAPFGILLSIFLLHSKFENGEFMG